ncbi:MAG: S-layer homology domain-containing protein [Oscillospiraceae bacterium]|nr:S-layer homology domain-containing protein [Oscillospiraceae bacterium]
MKKLMCVILSVVMRLSFTAGAFAAEASELTSIVGIAKSRLAVPEVFTEFESEKYTVGGENVYNLIWRTTGEDYSEIYASVLASGEIVSYNYHDADRNYDKTGVAAYEKEEYLKTAQEWIKHVNPSYTAELDMDAEVWIDGIHSHNVRVTFDRKVNGIPVQNDYVYVSLDKYTGVVTAMNAQWVHPEKIADAKNIISAEEAGKILGDTAHLRLRYEKLRDEAHAVLMYSPTRFGMMINAETGEEFTVEYVDREEGDAGGGAMSGATNDSAANEKFESSLSREELENIEEMESLLTKVELSDKIKKMTNTAVSSFTVKSVNYRNVGSAEDKKAYEARVYLTNGNGESANVTFDAKTGELKSLYTYLEYNPNKKQIKKREDMKQTAKRFIGTWAADVADKARVFEYGDEGKNVSGHFVFTHDEGGIEYAGNSIRIRVDESTGKILSFSKSWDKEITFETPENVISLDEATEKYIDAAAATLYYIGNKREMYASNNAAELALIYRFSDSAPAYVNAKTVECYDWNMGQEQNEPEKYTLQEDVLGHWAEKAVKTLADNGIVISYDEKFRPDEAITQKEIALLMDCFDGGYRPYEVTENDYKSYIERLVRQDVIKSGEKNPDKKVTREECAAYLVRMFGYGSAAELSGIYKTGFSDEAQISADKIGCVALAKGLGLVSGTGGKFNPKKNVTRAELAMMLYNALDK